ncbi:hypothetical protein GCM10010411_18780 [Actinomadura fulvescens]|uniref:Uncharacterized protein n=1 Tax=Actinomadura fulvescens TaxID=46160 RepID=A0ABP6BTC8_9ACTN
MGWTLDRRGSLDDVTAPAQHARRPSTSRASPHGPAARVALRELIHLDQVNAYLGGMISGLDITYDVGRPDDPQTFCEAHTRWFT